MLIPSIDLMSGKIVQLVHGEKKALEFDDFDYWINRFSSYPLVQLIDLDAAMSQGDNCGLISMICARLPCQVGGGIRTVDRGRELLSQGAKRVIFGSALLHEGRIDGDFAGRCANLLGPDCLTFAIDSRHGNVAIQGWREITGIDPLSMMSELEQFCGAFLYTHIDSEGTMTGFPIETAKRLRAALSMRKQLIVAGGIRSLEEVESLNSLAIDAVVGMAIYKGMIVEPK